MKTMRKYNDEISQLANNDHADEACQSSEIFVNLIIIIVFL
jgi:hypothetical protein